MIVADASVLIGVLLGRAETVEGVEREIGGAANQSLHAPDVIELETLNALRRLLRSRAITRDRAEQALVHLAATRLTRYPDAPLRGRIWGLRDSLSAHDAAYLALAETLDAVLMTADRGLATVAARVIGADRVRRLA